MSEKVPKAMQEKYDEIVAITDAVCKEHLSEEYAALARKLAAKLSRKRPSPLKRGRANSWACGIVYALGQVNFIFDSSQEVHMDAGTLCDYFGVAKSTGGNKAKDIRDMVGDMNYFDSEWMLPSMIDQNPMVWMIQVNGLMIDARRAPRWVQEMAFEKGIIPYLPEEKPEEDEE